MKSTFDPIRRKLLEDRRFGGRRRHRLRALDWPFVRRGEAALVPALLDQEHPIRRLLRRRRQGSFKKYGVDPTFVSGGPNIDPVANVASGQSQLGDRPIGR